MKHCKLRTALVIFVLLACTFSTTAQTVKDGDGQGKNALVDYSQKKGKATYSFIPLTEFDEFKTNQRLERANTISGDQAAVIYKKNKIFIQVDPDITTEEHLNRLLLLIVKIHGYDSYSVNL